MAFKLTHPDSEQEIEVSREQVPMYQTQGWQTKPNAQSPDPDKD